MTPAEAYQESCKLLDIVGSELIAHKDDLTPAVIVNIGWMLQMAQVHATLATVDPERCICPRSRGQAWPSDPRCPIHGAP